MLPLLLILSIWPISWALLAVHNFLETDLLWEIIALAWCIACYVGVYFVLNAAL